MILKMGFQLAFLAFLVYLTDLHTFVLISDMVQMPIIVTWVCKKMENQISKLVVIIIIIVTFTDLKVPPSAIAQLRCSSPTLNLINQLTKSTTRYLEKLKRRKYFVIHLCFATQNVV